jgi:DNA-binding transcriptional MerR regulator
MLAIGEVARRVGLRPSALRYYERLGLLPAPARDSGRRRYDERVFTRLRVIAFARECGFSLREVRQLFAGKPYSAAMRGLAHRKLAEMEQTIARIEAMRSLLRTALRCECLTLEQCGRRLSTPADGRRKRGS